MRLLPSAPLLAIERMDLDYFLAACCVGQSVFHVLGQSPQRTLAPSYVQ